MCAEKDETVVKYSVLEGSRQIFASKYLPYLPSEEEIRREIERRPISAIESMEVSNQVKVIIPRQGLVENPEKLVEGLVENPKGLVENPREIMKRLVEKAEGLGEKLAGTKIKILQLMSEDSTITIIEMAQRLSVSTTTIDKHIQQMKNKYIKRIGGDKGGRWVLNPD